MVHHDRCPLCTAEKISFHFSCTDHFISREIFQLFRCEACGFLFTQDYPDENEIYKYYESDEYISHSGTSQGLVNKIYHIIRQIMLHRKRRIIKTVSGLKKGSLLDVGCGTGHFANEMQKGGWSVKGIEINEKARTHAASAFGLDILAPDKITRMEAKSFDCITLWHVLEHFHDPYQYMSDIKRLLKPNGTCVVALPNSNSHDAEYYGPLWAAFDVPRHLWHFAPDTFDKFAETAGMVVERRLVLPFDVFYISVLSDKYKGSGMPFITGNLKAMWFSTLSLLNRKRSSSIIYILRKHKDQ